MQGVDLRVLHAYKIYKPDIEGGIPAVISSLTRGADGPIRHFILCARRFGLHRGYEIDGTPVEAVTSLGTLFSTPIAPGFITAFLRRAQSSDVVLHHAPLPLTDIAIVLGLPTDRALIVFWHAEIIGYSFLKKAVSPLIRRVLARADKIVVSGEPMIENSAFLRPHAAKCTVVPFGTDVTYWNSVDPQELDIVARMKRERPRHVLALGRLVGYKGFDILVRAMKRVDGHATIIGEGPMHAELNRLAAQLGLSDRIRFLGRLSQSEIRLIMHSADVFAFPSLTEAEAFGIVQIEAMAAGLPIVNTRLATTVPLVARDGFEALTVAPNDSDAFAAALNRLLDEPALAERLGKAGRERATSDFGEAGFGKRMNVIYEEALQSRKDRMSS